MQCKKVASTFSMSWKGHYGKNAKSQAYCVQRMIPTLLKLVDTLPKQKNGHFVDYGCADSLNCLYLQNLLRHKNLNQFSFIDLPENDWKTVNKNVENQLETAFRDLNGEKNKHIPKINTIPGSFYDQVLPENSVDIGYSSMAFHWKPTEHLPNLVSEPVAHANLLDESSREFQIWNEFGQETLAECLSARSKEIKTGGYLYFNISCRLPLPEDVSGFNMKNKNNQSIICYKQFYTDIGEILTEANLNIPKIPSFYLTPKEIENCINSISDSPWNIIQIDSYTYDSPYFSNFNSTTDPQLLENCAENYVQSVSAWCSKLFQNSEIEILILKKLKERIIKNPELYWKKDYVVAEVLLQKKFSDVKN